MRKYYEKKLFVNDFSVSPSTQENAYNMKLHTPSLCYNVKSKNGMLLGGNGLSHLSLPKSRTNPEEYLRGSSGEISIIKTWRYKYYSNVNGRDEYMLVCFASDNKLYFNNMTFQDPSYHLVSNKTFNSVPSAITFKANGDEVIAFSSPDDDMLVWYTDNNPYTVDGTPHFSSICYHNNRLFAIDASDNSVVKYSALSNPLDWTSTSGVYSPGSITMNDFKGDLRRLISFDNYVYVFRDYGISRILSYAQDSVYACSNIYNTSSKIYADTAVVCGSKIYFLQEDGLYCFDGYSATRVDLPFSDLITKNSQSLANACYHDGCYLLACKMSFPETLSGEASLQNNALVEYNVSNKTANITRGVDITCMTSVKDLLINKVITCVRNSDYVWQVTGDGKINASQSLPKLWKSSKINLGNFDKDKILKKVYLTCPCSATFSVSTDKMTKSISLTNKSGFQRLLLNVTGREFVFSISSSDPTFNIGNIELFFVVER